MSRRNKKNKGLGFINSHYYQFLYSICLKVQLVYGEIAFYSGTNRYTRVLTELA